MSITADYHLHSSFSGDSDTPMEEMIQQGITLDLGQMCFTEHQDFDYIYPHPQGTSGLFDLDTEAYHNKLISCREKYADKIQILFGVELGIQPHLAEMLSGYAKKFDFDFIIGSSHLCNRKDPYYPAFYENRTEKEAYLEYFTSILENLNVYQDFDVYGHLDYVVRYGPNKDHSYCFEDYEEVLTHILEKIIALGKGIEINTGGIRYGLKELNPATAILRRYRELGGEIITFGSDAHSPQNLLNGSHRAAEILKSCGFEHYTIYEKRIPRFIRL